MMEFEQKEGWRAHDDEKAQTHAAGKNHSNLEGAQISDDFAAFFAAPASQPQQQLQQPQQAGSSPVGSTLPHFDAFGSDFAAPVPLPAGVTQAYSTPFDSPDPVFMPTDSTAGASGSQPIPAPIDTNAETMPSRPMRSQSYTVPHSSGSAVDLMSIFHTTNAPPAGSSGHRHHHKKKSAAAAASPASAMPPKHSKKSSSNNLSPPGLNSHASASASQSQPKQQKEEPDPIFDGVIPEAVFSGALLARRSSEPTLGSRRAAEEAARAAAAGKPGATPSAASSASTATASKESTGPGLERRLTIRVEALATDKASNINLDPLAKDGRVTPRPQCQMKGCNESTFASGYCAAHLTEQFEPGTPTTIIRRVHGLWSKQVIVNRPGAPKLQIEWKFWKRGFAYNCKLWDDPVSGERTVLVNGKVNYRSRPPAGFWKLSMLLGRSKSSAFEVLVEGMPRTALQQATGSNGSVSAYSGPLEFELWIDGFPFTEAQNNFMSELGAAQQMAMLSAEAEEGDAKASSSSSSASKPSAKARHYSNLHYIHTHWSRTASQSKTRLGYTKNHVEWRFTLGGPSHSHSVSLTHSAKSGKRSLELDGKRILVHKPNWINGLLLQRSSTHRFDVAGVPCEVRIQKLDWSGSNNASDKDERPAFAYDLVVDGVPFAKCIKTLPEYAGGFMDVENTIKEQEAKAARKKAREEALARDPRTELSPE